MLNDLSNELLGYALLGSFIPTIFWIWFWMVRDRFCPEPRAHILGAFIFGALAALFTIPTQSFIGALFGGATIIALVLFVTAEEIIKYWCCWYISFRRNPYYNERIDPIIYMATGALGFATLENILYFLQYLNNFNLDIALLEGGKRLVGAGILHMVASAIVGVAMAMAFTSNRTTKRIALATGLVLAIVVHVGFNYLVTNIHADYTLIAFGITWVLFLVVIVSVELLRMNKKICPPPNFDNIDHL